jgi:hypothetical protein
MEFSGVTPESTLNAGKADFRCDLKTEVDFVPRGADFEMRLEKRSRFVLPREADFDMRLWKSTLNCRVKQTLYATTVVDFAPHGVDLRCKKRKALSGKPKRMKNQRKRIVLPPERA